ncbi:MerR family transcriptional regulator [Priestia megaterium]|uniref:MerR family transcriptional regulator n=1 Tax=Priestia megaterium TaxID=1404 RepID=UPI00355B7140
MNKNNIRLFDQESINWLTGVKYLKQCGMTVEDIKTYVDLCLKGGSTFVSAIKSFFKAKRDRSS